MWTRERFIGRLGWIKVRDRNLVGNSPFHSRLMAFREPWEKVDQYSCRNLGIRARIML